MAFDAGSVIGHFGLDTQEYEAGAGRIQKSTENITGSILKANVIYDLAKKALSALVSVAKDSIEAFKAQEKAEAQLAAVLKSTAGAAGITRQEVLALSDAFQKTTTFGDEVILSGQNILLTFTKIGKDIFPLATETMLDMSQALGQDLKSSAIQLGKALQEPITGITALRRVGVNFTDEQENLIKTLVNSGRSLEAQKLILKELQTEFGGSAKAARDTFGGAMIALNNTVDEVKETFGRYIAEAGKPFLESITNVVQGIKDFMNSKEGLEQIKSVLVPIVGAFAVLWDIGKKLFDYIKQFAIKVIGDLKTGFGDIAGKGNEASTAFTILGGAVQAIGIGFAWAGGIIKTVIQAVVDLVKIVEANVNVFKALGEALAAPTDASKWENVKNMLTASATAYGNLFKDAALNVKDMVTGLIEDLKTLGEDAKKTGAELQQTYTVTTGKIEIVFDNLELSISGNNAAIVKDTEIATNDIEKYWHDVAESGAAVTGASISAMVMRISQAIKNGLTNARMAVNAMAGAVAGAALAGATWWKDTWKNALTQLVGYISSFISQIGNLFNLYYDGQLTAIDNWYKAQKEAIEKSTADEETKKEQLETLDAEYQAKKAEQQKKAFIANQAMQIAQAIMSGAQAVMSIWATFAALPPLAIALTAVVVGITAAEIALIASQPVPAFGKGGEAPSNRPILVGEYGPEVLTLGQTSRIYPNDELGMFYGEKKIQQTNNYYGDINSDVDLDVASIKQANRLKAVMRA